MLDELKNRWLPELEAGRLSYSELAERLLQLQHSGGLAHEVDLDRARRCGLSEVVYGPGKPPEMIVEIAERLLGSGQDEVLVTRVDRPEAAAVCRRVAYSRYCMLGRTLRLRASPFAEPLASTPAEVAVVCAGSTDLPVAREALETLAWMRVAACCIVDVGVAGPYRLLAHLQSLRRCRVIVVVAGMEGALASVMGGLVACPVIAVPTSVGYGANLHGVTTLLSMLSSCAAGVTVVNIDGGFKGGYIAGLICRNSGDRYLAGVTTLSKHVDCQRDSVSSH